MELAAASRIWPATVPSLGKRLTSWKAAELLTRNTAVSSLALVFGLALMWVLVELLGADKVFAAAASFVAATSLHYFLGRGWIFAGTERGFASGYGYFVIIAGVGFAITVWLFAAIIRWTPVNYLVARVIVSAFAGLVMFLLNALLNFKRL
jgi:putative flippase GtrA